jgi:hypothetical protein
MRAPNLPQPHEQRKIERLLVKLAKLKPISAKSAPITSGCSTIPANLKGEKAG